MQNNTVINVENVYKSFKIPHEKHSSLKGAVLNLFKKQTFTKYEAARGISFEVKRGEFLGIIGRNGCGKSTMLKMLGGIYQPDSGRIKIDGTLSPFLELGVGFNPELTARENIYLNGTILGMTRKHIDSIFDRIVEFAELEEFVDMKLKNFSSGMQVRLAFSVAINAHADILLIDEVLAVGDINFQKKCFDVFREFKQLGKTIVFVSHDMNSVRAFCDRVLVFENGDKVFDGEPEGAIDLYTKLNFDRERTDKEIEESALKDELGNQKALIESFELYDSDNKPTTHLQTGKVFKLRLNIEFRDKVTSPVVGVIFRNTPSENLFALNSFHRPNPFKIGPRKAGSKLTLDFTSTMPLNTGTYLLTLAVSDQRYAEQYELLHMLNNFAKVEVTNPKDHWGAVNQEYAIEIASDSN